MPHTWPLGMHNNGEFQCCYRKKYLIPTTSQPHFLCSKSHGSESDSLKLKIWNSSYKGAEKCNYWLVRLCSTLGHSRRRIRFLLKANPPQPSQAFMEDIFFLIAKVIRSYLKMIKWEKYKEEKINFYLYWEHVNIYFSM